ncbi:hypothetical protein [Undibacterium sp. Ji42W]|uniref:hypothetical protein n=1 Tax=Undibacterium sp. Ji42W TaxID=3413039 RepID=UPI003BF5B41A
MHTKARLHKSMATPNDDALLSGLLISLNAKVVNAIIGKPGTRPAITSARRPGMNAMMQKGKAYKGKNTENKKLMKNVMREQKK